MKLREQLERKIKLQGKSTSRPSQDYIDAASLLLELHKHNLESEEFLSAANALVEIAKNEQCKLVPFPLEPLCWSVTVGGV